jgi:ribonuclease HI
VALTSALEWLLENNLAREEVVVKSDSKMLINQMAGKWKVRKGVYLPKHKEAKGLSSKFYKINYKWVPREQNKAADKLSREYYNQLF